jgi:hypothetical protein
MRLYGAYRDRFTYFFLLKYTRTNASGSLRDRADATVWVVNTMIGSLVPGNDTRVFQTRGNGNV